MKPIDIKNREQLAEAIKAAEGRAKERRISVDDVIDALAEVDERLKIISTKTDAVGTMVHVDVHAQRFPNAYRYTPESTHFFAELKKNGWRIVGISRGRTNGPSGRIIIELTAATKARIVERASTF